MRRSLPFHGTLPSAVLALVFALAPSPGCGDDGGGGGSDEDAAGPGDGSGPRGGDATEPEDDATEPEDDAAEPEDDATEHEDDATDPSDDTSEPEDDTAELEDDATPDVIEPGDDVTEPEEDTAEPEDDAEGDTTEPEDDATEPEVCDAISTKVLLARLADLPPILDGQATDEAWSCSTTLQVNVKANLVYKPEGSPVEPSYPGLGSTQVRLKAAYTGTDLYVLAQYDDPTKSLARLPWEKQADGSWTQLQNKDSTGHENTYYEDKFAMQWDVNTSGFATDGCFSSCHLSSDEPLAPFPGKKWNPFPGEVADMWHWKSVRTAPNGQLDDQSTVWVDKADPNVPKEWGRVSDPKSGGGYNDNTFAKFKDACAGDPDGSLGLPCFMGPAGAEVVAGDVYWLFDGEKQPFADAFAPGDQVAGMVTAPFIGSRGDVEAVAEWADGVWTIEIRRSLTTETGETDDVQFDDLSAAYPFGVAVFDDTQINHAIHAGVLVLEFLP